MNAIVKERYCEFREVQNELTDTELTQVVDSEFNKWNTQWQQYVKYGGDRLPRKPPTP